MYLNSRKNPIKFQGHRSKAKVVGSDFLTLYLPPATIRLYC